MELDREHTGRSACTVRPGSSAIEQSICASEPDTPGAQSPGSRDHCHSDIGNNDATAQTSDGRVKRILVIDDEPSILRAIQRCLSQYAVTIAGSAKAGLRHAQLNTYDLIISDLHLPDLTGVQLFRTLLQERPDVTPRFLIMTGGTHDEELRQALVLSRLPVLYKPFRPAELREQVEGSLHDVLQDVVHSPG